jgi:hypothetical protein
MVLNGPQSGIGGQVAPKAAGVVELRYETTVGKARCVAVTEAPIAPKWKDVPPTPLTPTRPGAVSAEQFGRRRPIKGAASPSDVYEGPLRVR